MDEIHGHKSETSRRRWFLHSFFVSIGGSLLMTAFATDIMYSQNALMQWSNASEWLIAVGLMFALVAAIVLVVEILLGRGWISWIDFGLLATAVVLSLINVFVHSRDAWTSVVPQGIWLSGVVTLLLLFAGVRGWTAIRPPIIREGVGE